MAPDQRVGEECLRIVGALGKPDKESPQIRAIFDPIAAKVRAFKEAASSGPPSLQADAERDSAPLRDANREPANSVYSGSQGQENR